MLRSETTAQPDRLQHALAGLKAYQQAPRVARTTPAAAYRCGRATLLDYGGHGPPLVAVPSLINPPTVLDFTAEQSLMRFLATLGVRALLLDWGSPDESERDLDIGGHVMTLLLPLLRQLDAAPILAGYCLGGTMAIAAAAHHPVRGLATLATPWRFAGFPDSARDGLAELHRAALPAAERIGLLPMEILQTGFWRLDPARTVAKFEAFAKLDPTSAKAAAFVALEDWANDGPPLTLAAGNELIDNLFGADRTGIGHWQVGGRGIAPEGLACPLLDIVSTNDRIVPAATSHGHGETMTLGLGHVGMIVGGSARALMWTPLAEWITRVLQH